MIFNGEPPEKSLVDINSHRILMSTVSGPANQNPYPFRAPFQRCSVGTLSLRVWARTEVYLNACLHSSKWDAGKAIGPGRLWLAPGAELLLVSGKNRMGVWHFCGPLELSKLTLVGKLKGGLERTGFPMLNQKRQATHRPQHWALRARPGRAARTSGKASRVASRVRGQGVGAAAESQGSLGAGPARPQHGSLEKPKLWGLQAIPTHPKRQVPC